MKLLGAIASPYVARVLMFARLKDIDLPLEEVPGGTPRSPEFRALTPIAKIPALVVEDRVLAESEIICEYIEDAYPAPSGLPADPLDRAMSRLVARITDLYLAPHTGKMFTQMNPQKRDADVVKATAALISDGFGYLEHFMDDGPFCVGAEPTLGDCALAPYLMLLKKSVIAIFDEVDDPTEGDGRLAEWWSAIQGHDICKTTVDEYADAVDAFMVKIRQRS